MLLTIEWPLYGFTKPCTDYGATISTGWTKCPLILTARRNRSQSSYHNGSRCFNTTIINDSRLDVQWFYDYYAMCSLRGGPLWICVRKVMDGIITHMMTSSNGIIFRVTGHSQVTGESSAQRSVTRNFDVFFDLHPNKLLSKQSWGWWFEMSSRPLWSHHNDLIVWWLLWNKEYFADNTHIGWSLTICINHISHQ